MANPNPNPPITVASAIYKIQLYLLETPSTPFDLLIAASTLLSKPDYDDVVTERTISDLCGYPLCLNPLPSPADRRRKGKYRVSLSEHKVYDLQETYSYCCDECLIGSRALKGSMSDERRADVDVRKAKVEEVLRLFGYFDGDEEGEEAKKGESSGSVNLEIREKQRVKAGDVKLNEWMGPSNAIEGYVPQLDRGSKFTSNLESIQRLDSAKSTEVDFSTVTVGDRFDGVPSKGSSVLTNDVSEMIPKKLEDVVTTEKGEANKRSSKSSKPKSQKDATNDDVGKMNYSDVGFTSSIIFGNEFDAALPKTCAVSAQDASELIAKQLEDVVIAEKTAAKVKASKSPRSKSRKKATSSKSDKMDFQSNIIIGNPVNAVAPKTSSVSSLDSAKQSAEKLEYDVHVKNKIETTGYNESDNILRLEGVSSGKKEVSEETGLKSSLKTSRSKGGNRSVKWSDEGDKEALEDKKDTPQVMQEEDSDSSFRIASAEACAAALSQAAEAVASGEADAGDAVSEAEIVILPQPQYGEGGGSEADEEAFEFDRGVLKWPKKTVLLDTDMFDVEDSWHDTPPEGFSLTLSSFATMWMALFGWITCSSLAYIYGRDESSHEDFLFVNGREYPRKIFIRDGKSYEIRQALDGFICRALPVLVMDLRLPTPVSTLEKFAVFAVGFSCCMLMLGWIWSAKFFSHYSTFQVSINGPTLPARLLDTMSFVEALPSFKMKQWQVIILLFVEALSVHRLPSLAPQMTSRSMLLHKVLNAARLSSEEYETMRDIIMPLGRLPQFSMQSGA